MVGEAIYNSKSRTFLMFCFCFLSGVGIFSALDSAIVWVKFVYGGFLLVAFMAVFFWPNIQRRFICLCLLFFILGAGRFLLAIPAKNMNEISFYNGETAIVTGLVKEVFLNDGAGKRYLVEADKIEVYEVERAINGRLLVRDKNNSEYVYGNRISFKCLLGEPQNLDENFRYDQYLSRMGVWTICAGNDFKLFDSSAVNIFLKISKLFFNFKQMVENKVGELWPEPESSLMGGILYGARASLPSELKEDFNRVGITHIVAISGYNIAIVVLVLQNILSCFGLDKRKIFWLLVVGVFLFVLFSGASSSVVRAGIMGIIVLLAGYLGRSSRIGNVLVFTAVIMLLLNPYVMVWDAGFQLSFLATLGLIYLTPLFKNWPSFAGETMAAIIITLPLILYQFGRLSLVAPVVNLLVLWIIPYLMLFGFLAILFSFIFYPLGQALAGVALVGLKFLLFITRWFADLSWSALDISIPLWLMFAIYLYFFWLIYHFQKENRS